LNIYIQTETQRLSSKSRAIATPSYY